MSENICPFCSEPVSLDSDYWKKVTGWVGGPRKDSMRLREDAGEFAHEDCVTKVSQKVAPWQGTLFEMDEGEVQPSSDDTEDLTGFLFGKD